MRLAFREWQDFSRESAKIRPITPALRPLRILLIDDDPSILRSLADILTQDGHTVLKTDGGEAGLRAFIEAQRAGSPFEAVITDLGMPIMDGRRVAAEIRGIEPSVPIVMLTGWGHRMTAEDDTPDFVDRVLSKPPKIHELRLALTELVRDTAGRGERPA